MTHTIGIVKLKFRRSVGTTALLFIALAVAWPWVGAQAAFDPSCVNAAGCPADASYFQEEPSSCAPGKGYCYVKPKSTELSVHIGSTAEVKDIGQYIAVAYTYGLGVAGLLAVVMMMIGGVRYLVAGGDSGAVAKAKANISDALVGLALALGAYLILNTINPNILKLQIGGIRYILPKPLSSCATFEQKVACGEPFWLTQVPNAPPNAPPEQRLKLNQGDKPADALEDCIGRGCDKSGCSGIQYRCRPIATGETADCGTAQDSNKGQGEPVMYACKSCMMDSLKCSPTGANDQCCSGRCGSSGVCTGGRPGNYCSKNEDCESNICQTNWGNSCSAGLTGSPCAGNDTECASGLKCATSGKNLCTPGTEYSYCDGNEECNNGLVCNTSGINVCMPDGAEKKFGCSSNGDCAGSGGYCSKSTVRRNFCTNGSVGAPCDANNQCASNKCDTKRYVCVSGANGESCDSDSDCTSSHCFTEGDFNVCVSGEAGTPCDNRSNTCVSGLNCIVTGWSLLRRCYTAPSG